MVQHAGEMRIRIGNSVKKKCVTQVKRLFFSVHVTLATVAEYWVYEYILNALARKIRITRRVQHVALFPSDKREKNKYREIKTRDVQAE